MSRRAIRCPMAENKTPLKSTVERGNTQRSRSESRHPGLCELACFLDSEFSCDKWFLDRSRKRAWREPIVLSCLGPWAANRQVGGGAREASQRRPHFFYLIIILSGTHLAWSGSTLDRGMRPGRFLSPTRRFRASFAKRTKASQPPGGTGGLTCRNAPKELKPSTQAREAWSPRAALSTAWP